MFLTMAGGFYFFAFVALVSTLALHEFYLLSRAKGALPQVGLGILLGLCVNGVFMFSRLRTALLEAVMSRGYAIPLPTMAQTLMILFLLFIPILLLVELFRNRGSALLNVASTLFGVAYVSLFLGTLIGLRELFIPEDFPVYAHFNVPGLAVPDDIRSTIYQWGGYTLIAVFVSIWMCDSAAYFAGRAFGRHKLFPRVSPNKTWEGAVAGLVAAIGTFLLARGLILPYLSIASALVCGSIVGVFGQLGDLIESLLKRDAGVKDSSALIPGHGGILDRFDSLIFVAPLLFFYLDFLVF
jgi:phosphatidate cytidylyltransferase